MQIEIMRSVDSTTVMDILLEQFPDWRGGDDTPAAVAVLTRDNLTRVLLPDSASFARQQTAQAVLDGDGMLPLDVISDTDANGQITLTFSVPPSAIVAFDVTYNGDPFASGTFDVTNNWTRTLTPTVAGTYRLRARLEDTFQTAQFTTIIEENQP